MLALWVLVERNYSQHRGDPVILHKNVLEAWALGAQDTHVLDQILKELGVLLTEVLDIAHYGFQEDNGLLD